MLIGFIQEVPETIVVFECLRSQALYFWNAANIYRNLQKVDIFSPSCMYNYFNLNGQYAQPKLLHQCLNRSRIVQHRDILIL